MPRPKPNSRSKAASPAPAPGKPARPAAEALSSLDPLTPDFSAANPDTRLYIGDCREILPRIPEVRNGSIDLIFADPPFNWNRGYDKWDDAIPDSEYLDFTYRWIDLCIGGLRSGGSFWINIPDDWAAEIVVHCKQRGLSMVNWCIWHYRFGQNNKTRFISSKVHALYFAKPGRPNTWNLSEILEPSDRATTYFDPRTLNKKEGTAGMRAPMDVWYGRYWGRIQGNNEERRPGHDNQLPEAYLERVIRACSNPGDLVLDPFNGSGTTGTVARALQRRFIGTEYSDALAKAAWERITIKGPVRLGATLRQSSAIFNPRKAGSATLKKFKVGKHSESKLLEA